MQVGVEGGHYVFAASKDPAREASFVTRRAVEEARIAALVEDGAAAVRTTYSDGGQHAFWASLAAKGTSLGEVSRPEALAFAGQETIVIPARRRPVPVPEAVWAAWAEPGSVLSLTRMAGFVPSYERGADPFAGLAVRFEDRLPRILRATSVDALASPGAPFAGSLASAQRL